MNEREQEVQADLAELIGRLSSALDSLGNAEDCETGADLRANLDDAQAEISEALKECLALRGMLT